MEFTSQEVKDFGNTVQVKEPLWMKLGRNSLVIVLTLVIGIFTAAISGIFISIGSNASLNGLQIVFDPMITIGYIAVAYLLGHFNDFSKGQQYKLFLFSLLLSFIFNFIQGALLLVILLPLLKKLKLV
jgi:hypothetical protein